MCQEKIVIFVKLTFQKSQNQILCTGSSRKYIGQHDICNSKTIPLTD